MTQKVTVPGRVEIVRHLFNRFDNHAGGITVFARHDSGNSFFEVSTSVCSRYDMYNKKFGYSTCLSNMESGKSVRLPISLLGNIGVGRSRKTLTRDQLLYLVDQFFFCFTY